MALPSNPPMPVTVPTARVGNTSAGRITLPHAPWQNITPVMQMMASVVLVEAETGGVRHERVDARQGEEQQQRDRRDRERRDLAGTIDGPVRTHHQVARDRARHMLPIASAA